MPNKHIILKGIAASPGIVIQPAMIIFESVTPEMIPRKKIIKSDISDELSRFRKGMALTASEIKNSRKRLSLKIDEEHAQIFQMQLLVMEDPAFVEKVSEKIKTGLMCAEWSIFETIDEIMTSFSSVPDEYFKERAHDVKDVGFKIIQRMMNFKVTNLAKVSEDVIVIGVNLTPSQTADMNRIHIKGFATQAGGRTSHVAIIARSMNIPAVVGLNEMHLSHIEKGDMVILDGISGIVIVDPPSTVLSSYRKKAYMLLQSQSEIFKQRGKAAISKNGRKISIYANIDLSKELPLFQKNKPDGIGLYRTEYLFRGKLPDEEEQLKNYISILKRMHQKPVVIRTMDIGGDKVFLPNADYAEKNPFLGWRAIRFCLDKRDIFETQLKALIRASEYGNLSILFPMVSSKEELEEAKSIFVKVKKSLERKYHKKYQVRIGVLVEIPSLVLVLDQLCPMIDFLSIGTNDLIQYTIAVDRTNAKVAHLYEPMHPAVLRLIKMTIDSARQFNLPVSMCGEMAGTPLYTELLLGMGLEIFSMGLVTMHLIKNIIRQTDINEAGLLSQRIMRMSSASESRACLTEYMEKKYPVIFKKF